MSAKSRSVAVSILIISSAALGDPNDWINVGYIKRNADPSDVRSTTSDAEQAIVHSADTYAQKGPWSVTNVKGVLPPSGDIHDYLSWAPYHWPNCNWCTSGRNHLAHTGGSSNDANSDGEGGTSDTFSSPSTSGADSGSGPSLQARHRRMNRVRLNGLAHVSQRSIPLAPQHLPDSSPGDQSPIQLPVSIPALTQTGAESERTYAPSAGSPTPAQAAAKKANKSACTPSPTKSLPPSATWTTCPYVVRDGQVNPDVRTLNGVGAIGEASQATLYNAIAYALEGSPEHSRNAAAFVEWFFLNAPTRMNPNMNFGQIVRGPGPKGRQGTFTGVLDLRGIVKVVNAVQILRTSGSPEWTDNKHQGMVEWSTEYVNWLDTSDIGKSTATRPNNHGTFYVSQVTALSLLSGNNQRARQFLQEFFSKQFMDQIAASGEQPFEAARTRPFHYRCFNLEALITNAKLGDQLGLNLWSAKSKYGGTIQTAVDYTMRVGTKTEDITELAPHVAAVAAAYGDPSGKYSAYLRRILPNYQSKPFWYYDQTAAISNSPAAKKRPIAQRREEPEVETSDFGVFGFECPEVFKWADEVELEDDLFVTCEMLRPFYEIPQLSE
ncbi:alginate lyase-domain-containing protein [Infundibulicybe gibba]|nr:alginate lyase-domain-containing protein [Infundibulicybe gibba]